MGSRSAGHLRSNARAVGLRLDADTLRPVTVGVDDVPGDTVDPRHSKDER